MAISIQIDKDFSDKLDQMIKEIELNIQKTMKKKNNQSTIGGIIR